MRAIAAAVLLVMSWGCRRDGRAGATARLDGGMRAEELPGKAQLRPPGCARDASRERAAAARANDLRSCPSAVAGARTKVEDVAGGIRIVVTAPTGRAAREIRTRSMRLTAATLATGDALSGGPSDCPIHYLPGTEAMVQFVRRGVRFTVTARRPEAIAALRESVRRRAATFSQPFELVPVAAVAVTRPRVP